MSALPGTHGGFFQGGPPYRLCKKADRRRSHGLPGPQEVGRHGQRFLRGASETLGGSFFYVIISFMKLNLEINNLAKIPIKKDFFEAVAKKILENSGDKFLNPPAGGKNISLSLAIVSKEEIKKLNKIYRKKNEPTDVLSFAEYKNIAEMRKIRDKNIFLGEVILCYDDIKEYASKKGINIKQELAAVTAHGILHLLGMRHGKRMFGIQEKMTKIF